MDDRSRPASVVGPRDFRPFACEAATCAGVAMVIFSVEEKKKDQSLPSVRRRISSRRPDSSPALAPGREHIPRHAPNPTHAHAHAHAHAPAPAPARTRTLIILRSPTARAFRRRCVCHAAGRTAGNSKTAALDAATTIDSLLTTFYCSLTPLARNVAMVNRQGLVAPETRRLKLAPTGATVNNEGLVAPGNSGPNIAPIALY